MNKWGVQVEMLGVKPLLCIIGRHARRVYMPIQFVECDSLSAVEQKIRFFEERYKISSESFLTDKDQEDTIPEFHALEWSFLIMQKKAMLEDEAVPSWRALKSRIKTVDIQAVAHSVAA